MARFKKVVGYTLLEVMTCLSILAIASAIAVPSFMYWRHHTQFAAQVKRFKNVLVLGRSSAVNDNETVEVCPSIHHRICDCHGDWTQDILVHEINGRVLSVMTHPKDLLIDYRGNLGHNDRLVFGSLGATVGQNGSFYINQGREHAKITVNLAGRIKGPL